MSAGYDVGGLQFSAKMHEKHIAGLKYIASSKWFQNAPEIYGLQKPIFKLNKFIKIYRFKTKFKCKFNSLGFCVKYQS